LAEASANSDSMDSMDSIWNNLGKVKTSDEGKGEQNLGIN